MSLVIVGSVAFDTIETPFCRREKIVGGSGTYCSLAASLFTRPRLVGVVGRDFPRTTLSLLRSRHIDLRGLTMRRGKTFHWEGRYEADPNVRTTIRTDLNVFADFRPEVPPAYARAGIVFLANIDPDGQDFILRQFRAPGLVAMDTIRFWIETKRDSLVRELGRVDLLFANDEEAKLLSGESNLIKAGRALLGFGPRLIVLKKGEHGALVFGREFLFGALAHPEAQVVDPTGAGDSFAGGFLGYLDQAARLTPREFRKAAVYGSVLASFAIEDFGISRLAAIDRPEVEARYREFKRFMSF